MYYYLGQDAIKQGLSYENNYTEKQKKQIEKRLNNNRIKFYSFDKILFALGKTQIDYLLKFEK